MLWLGFYGSFVNLTEFQHEHLNSSVVRLFEPWSFELFIEHLACSDQFSPKLSFEVGFGLGQSLSGVLLILRLRDHKAG